MSNMSLCKHDNSSEAQHQRHGRQVTRRNSPSRYGGCSKVQAGIAPEDVHLQGLTGSGSQGVTAWEGALLQARGSWAAL